MSSNPQSNIVNELRFARPQTRATYPTLSSHASKKRPYPNHPNQAVVKPYCSLNDIAGNSGVTNRATSSVASSQWRYPVYLNQPVVRPNYSLNNIAGNSGVTYRPPYSPTFNRWHYPVPLNQPVVRPHNSDTENSAERYQKQIVDRYFGSFFGNTRNSGVTYRTPSPLASSNWRYSVPFNQPIVRPHNSDTENSAERYQRQIIDRYFGSFFDNTRNSGVTYRTPSPLASSNWRYPVPLNQTVVRHYDSDAENSTERSRRSVVRYFDSLNDTTENSESEADRISAYSDTGYATDVEVLFVHRPASLQDKLQCKSDMSHRALLEEFDFDAMKIPIGTPNQADKLESARDEQASDDETENVEEGEQSQSVTVLAPRAKVFIVPAQSTGQYVEPKPHAMFINQASTMIRSPLYPRGHTYR